jgi:DNA-binding Xre family transcriptional regulator
MVAKKNIVQNVKELLDRMPGNTVVLKKELADYVGVSMGTVHRWYADKNNVINPVNYAKVCEFLGCKLDDLIKLD